MEGDARFWTFNVGETPDNDGNADLTAWTAVVDEQDGGVIGYFRDFADAEAFWRYKRRTAGGE